MTDRSDAISRSWTRNAASWTRAVREGLIASRKAATDEAVVRAVLARRPERWLDAGCGEGWLVRRVCQELACEAVGLDASADLIAAARSADPANRYEVCSYDDLVAGTADLGRDFDVAVFNYALFDQDLRPLLTSVRSLLTPSGIVVIQTLHPWSSLGEASYRDGWRCEDFAGFDGGEWAPMPWYFRTLESWHALLRRAGLGLLELAEPSVEPGGPSLSLLMTCGIDRRENSIGHN